MPCCRPAILAGVGILLSSVGCLNSAKAIERDQQAAPQRGLRTEALRISIIRSLGRRSVRPVNSGPPQSCGASASFPGSSSGRITGVEFSSTNEGANFFRGTAGDVPRDLSAAPTANRRPKSDAE